MQIDVTKNIQLPDKHFKTIRYYGIYAKNHRHKRNLHLYIPKENRRFHTHQNVWKTSIFLAFHFDPLLCKCGHEMTLLQFFLKGTPFLYLLYHTKNANFYIII